MSFNHIFEKVYFDVTNPGSFGGLRRLYLESRKLDPKIKYEDVKSWVQNQLTYTLHKQARINFKRNRILVQRKNEQFECDLVDMRMFSRSNNGFKYIVTIIDCFSKFLYAYPIKNKTPIEIIKVLKKVFQTDKPMKIRTDRGLEFDNKKVLKFLDSEEVQYFTSNDSKIKCAIVERVNRTLKSKMFRYFTAKGTRRYIDVLQHLVDSYNKSFHRTIKMRPIDVSDSNRQEVFENIYKVSRYRDLYTKMKKKKHDVDDNVRVKYDLNKSMEKSYYPLWTDKVYKIEKIFNKPIKPVYKVSSEGQTVKRLYYPEEIQKVGKDPVYRIEKIIQKRQRQGIPEVLVKYIGYPDEFNQWIPKANIINLKAGSTTATHRRQKK